MLRSAHRPTQKNSYYYRPKSSFLEKIFKNQIRKLLALRGFLIFEKLFEFSVMGEGSRLHAGEPPALVRQWAQTYRGMKVPSKSTFQVCTRP
jgi:hypothetical protein